MPWYKAGTVSVTQNSNAVIGSGTAFIANSRVGDGFRGPDGGWYEVTNIASDTAMSISPNYQGASNSAGGYALAPLQGYVKESADRLRALVLQYGDKLAALGTTGNYDILPLVKGGTGVSVTSNAALLVALGALPSAGGAYAPKLQSLQVTQVSVSATQGGFIGWNESNIAGFSGEMAFVCNKGGGTGGFTFSTVNAGNTERTGVATLTSAGIFNAAGLQVAGRNVVEAGSNTNGNFVRFGDGTQICWNRAYAFGPSGAGTTATAFWTPPMPFVGNAAEISVTLQFAESNDNFTCSRISGYMVAGSETRATITANFSVSQVYRLGLMAIGRWY
ncbi:phage tail protein [Pseudomonas syringae]|uniref:phage tail protein n=1 Tax=Pseudomonas syringae TaxID=317 RepID=UPI00165D401D|nr:phage tail protein [Pseudomonas syringae]